MPDQIRAVRAAQASDLLGIGISTFWRWHAQRPDFPRGLKLSPRVTVFDLGELIAWRNAQAQTQQQL